MSKITKAQFGRLVHQTRNKNLPPVLVEMTLDIAYKQVTSGRWTHGKPVELYMQDDIPCIRYQDGQWWHYDVVNGTWY